MIRLRLPQVEKAEFVPRRIYSPSPEYPPAWPIPRRRVAALAKRGAEVWRSQMKAGRRDKWRKENSPNPPTGGERVLRVSENEIG